ncbi:hypothetical protein KM043_010189 [Ampulex compressa]|nr:hypothetical protein KM043_010189 [Ampulex compressa]
MNFLLSKPVYYASALGTLAGGLILFREYMGGPMYSGTEKLDGKVVIITGATGGIGHETVKDLASRNAKVIMACRDMKKCEELRRDIVLDTKNKYVYCRTCDLASQESIRKFVNIFKKEHSQLHVLINNAGIMKCPKSATNEGIELQLGVNHMGHFLLTNLLLDVLKQSAPSRIINVASAAYRYGEINGEDLNSSKDYNAEKAFTQSKLAVVLFTKELANRLKGTAVTANAVHPGVVNTQIVRYSRVYNSILFKIFLKPFSWPFIKSPKQGAQPLIRLAVDPSLEKVSGEYFSNDRIMDVTEKAKDEKLTKWMWAVSEKWTRLNMA